MRKMAMILLVLMILPFCVNAQPDVTKSVWFGGVKTESGETRIVGGGGGKVSESNFWVFAYSTVGQYDAALDEQEAAIGAEVAYLYPISTKLSVGLIISPLNIDWQNITGAGATTYIANTTGALFHFWFSQHFGVAGSAKYKFDFPTGTELQNKTALALIGTYRP